MVISLFLKFDCLGVLCSFVKDNIGDGLWILSDDSWFYRSIRGSVLNRVKSFSTLSALNRDLESVFSPDYGIND